MVESAAEKYGFSPEEENRQNKYLSYFGGALSIDGSTLIIIANKGERQIARPFIEFQSKPGGRLIFFEKHFNAKPRSTRNSLQVIWSGYKAASIGERLLDQNLAPSRAEEFTGFKNWLNTEDAEERLEIAQMLREEDAHKPIPIEHSTWVNLLSDKQFAGGVVSRAMIRFYEINPSTIRLALLISSRNISLLNSLSKEFGGKVKTEVGKGHVIKINGQVSVSEKGTNFWEIYGEDAVKVLEYVEENLGFELPEGWQEKLPSKEREWKEKKELIRADILKNLSNYLTGNDSVLKSAYSFAEQYDVDVPVEIGRAHV